MKYYYEEEFCNHYRQLMPVTYELDTDNEYHKVGMACSNADQCDLSVCKHFAKAPETLEPMKLRDTLIGAKK